METNDKNDDKHTRRNVGIRVILKFNCDGHDEYKGVREGGRVVGVLRGQMEEWE